MRPRAPERQGGYTYVGLLLAVALAGVALGGLGQVWSTAVKREREARLLAIGAEFQRALKSYADAGPGARLPPARLEDLVDDRRLPTTRRHLRRVYADPMTGRPEWGLVKAGDHIVGVYSQSGDTPLARPPALVAESAGPHRVTYRDWVFRLEAAAEDSGAQGRP